MLRTPSIALALAVTAVSANAAPAGSKTIEFPCSRNLADGRVLVDGTQWDDKMRELGYELADGEYVPWKVLRFTEQVRHEEDGWADGTCRLKLLPVER